MSRTMDSPVINERWVLVKWRDGSLEIIDGNMIRPYNIVLRVGQWVIVDLTPLGGTTQRATVISGSDDFGELSIQMASMQRENNQRAALDQSSSRAQNRQLYLDPSAEPTQTHQTNRNAEQYPAHRPGAALKLNSLDAVTAEMNSETGTRLSEISQPGPSNISSRNTRMQTPQRQNLQPEPAATEYTSNENPQPGPSNILSENTRNRNMYKSDSSDDDDDTIMQYIRDKTQSKSVLKQMANVKKSHSNTKNKSKPQPKKKIAESASVNAINLSPRPVTDSEVIIPHMRRSFGMPHQSNAIATQSQLDKLKPKSNPEEPGTQPGPSKTTTSNNRNEAIKSHGYSDYDSNVIVPHIRKNFSIPKRRTLLDNHYFMKRKLLAERYQSQSAPKRLKNNEMKIKTEPIDVDDLDDQPLENERTLNASPQPGPSNLNTNARRRMARDRERRIYDPVTMVPTSILEIIRRKTEACNMVPFNPDREPTYAECPECIRSNALQLIFALQTKQKIEEVSDIIKRLAEVAAEIRSLRSQNTNPEQREEERTPPNTSQSQTEDPLSFLKTPIKQIFQRANAGHQNIISSVEIEVNRIKSLLYTNRGTETRREENTEDERPGVQMVPIGNGNTRVPFHEYMAIDWNFYVHATRSLLTSVCPQGMIATTNLNIDTINDIVRTVAENSQIEPILVRNAIRTIQAEEYEKRKRKIKKRKERRRRKREQSSSNLLKKKSSTSSTDASSVSTMS